MLLHSVALLNVTDCLGRVDKCFVPTDVLYKLALSRQLQPSQLVQYGLPIRKGFWALKSATSPPSEEATAKANRIARALRSIRRRRVNGDDGGNAGTSSSSVTTTDLQKIELRNKLGHRLLLLRQRQRTCKRLN